MKWMQKNGEKIQKVFGENDEKQKIVLSIDEIDCEKSFLVLFFLFVNKSILCHESSHSDKVIFTIPANNTEIFNWSFITVGSWNRLVVNS